jgi:hypothetical protein
MATHMYTYTFLIAGIIYFGNRFLIVGYKIKIENVIFLRARHGRRSFPA